MKINEKHARGISTEATFVQAALAADLPPIEACMADLPIYELADLARTAGHAATHQARHCRDLIMGPARRRPLRERTAAGGLDLEAGC